MIQLQTDILLLTPPFTQLNTPYPATPVLTSFLKQQGYIVAQADLSIETFLAIFSRKGLQQIFAEAKQKQSRFSANAQRMLILENEYIANIDLAINFLQGHDHALATSICNGILPHGPRFNSQADMEWLFGQLGVIDKAKYIATFFIEDIGDFIAECIDPHFGFSRYAEHLATAANTFENIYNELHKTTILTDFLCQKTKESIVKHNPKVVAITVPFLGNLLGALKIGQYLKQYHPEIKVILGGGYVNTELRTHSESRLFQFVDYVCLDDGELTVNQLLAHIIKNESFDNLIRTFYLKENKVEYINSNEYNDFSHELVGLPDYEGLPLNQYISFLEMANPMHRLWSDGRWNKLAVAHGCYWHKCSFCDVSLDYIKQYSAASAEVLCQRIEQIIAQTNQRGFHFVDEAAPPQVLKNLAIELIKRNIRISWWANVRFEKSFTPDLCRLLEYSGCIAVSGGLEVASDRLLNLMEKGVSIEQVAQVTNNFTKAGIMVHAYLMYGFPTQTAQETIDSLEVVRQLFENNLIQSAFWHRFVMTAHSPIGLNPEKYGVTRVEAPVATFALNDCEHIDPKGCDHEKFSFGLKKALYNYMHQMCFDFEMQDWFDFKVPHTKIIPKLIFNIIHQSLPINTKDNAYILWLGSQPNLMVGKKGNVRLCFEGKHDSFSLETNKNEAEWLKQVLAKCILSANNSNQLYSEIDQQYEKITGQKFHSFLSSKNGRSLRKNGLLLI